jgi:putative NADH-flavin reductase
MARITVLGGTGYAGSNIVQVAAQRAHNVTVYSRNPAKAPVAGVTYRTANLADPATQDAVVANAQIVVSALSPRGDLNSTGALRAVVGKIAERAQAAGVRLGVVGGAGSLLVAPGGPKLVDTPDFPEQFKAEANEMDTILQDLRASDPALDWFFVSPAGGFGAWAPGEATGNYRLGTDLLLVDDAGQSEISGADFAAAVVTEIEQPAHRRARFTVAY